MKKRKNKRHRVLRSQDARFRRGRFAPFLILGDFKETLDLLSRLRVGQTIQEQIYVRVLVRQRV
jgi:hypothetical protein